MKDEAFSSNMKSFRTLLDSAKVPEDFKNLEAAKDLLLGCYLKANEEQKEILLRKAQIDLANECSRFGKNAYLVVFIQDIQRAYPEEKEKTYPFVLRLIADYLEGKNILDTKVLAELLPEGLLQDLWERKLK